MADLDTTRATLDALDHLDPTRLRWAEDVAATLTAADLDALRPAPTPWYRRRSTIAVAVLAALGGLGVVAATAAAADPRLAEPGCAVYTVQPGDNLTRIARDHGLTLDTVLAWNPQFDNPHLIYVDDEVCVGRDGAASVNEVQRVEAPASSLDGFIAEREPDGRATPRAVLAALVKAGAHGTQLVTLAAITEGESGRKIDALGDTGIQTSKWGPSGGVFQIRSVKAERGQGTTRDLDRVLTLEGGARSAVELWDQAQARGQDPGSPWTAYLKGWHRAHLDGYAAIARAEGWLS